MERSEKAKMGIFMVIAGLPFIGVGIYMLSTIDNFYYMIPIGVAAILIFEGANQFITNKFGKEANSESLKEQTVPTTIQEQKVSPNSKPEQVAA